jgi:PAS domain S-box-containing protein
LGQWVKRIGEEWDHPFVETAVLVAAALVMLIGFVITWYSRRRANVSQAEINRIILRRLHLALDAADAGAWEWRIGLPSLRASGFARLLGVSDDEDVTVQMWEDALHPEDRERWRRTFEEAIRNGVPWTSLHRVVDPTGGVRWLDARAEPIRQSDGTVDGMLGICVDVTERQLRQQQTREAARLAHEVGETAAALTALADEEYIWAEARESAIRIFGCERADVLPSKDVRGLALEVIDPASGVAVAQHLPDFTGEAFTLIPVVIADALEAHLVLEWDTPPPDLDRGWIAAADRFAANIAIALVIARRHTASSDRDRLARRLQAGLMPTAGVSDGPLRVETIYQPGEDRLMLGGDFLDVIQLADGQVNFILGDVCGHGPAEAALGTILRSAWTGLASTGDLDPARWIAVLDQILIARREQAHTFVTAVAGTCDPRTGTITYAVAGHPPPLLITDATARPSRGDLPKGEVIILDEGAGPALGLHSTMQPSNATALLPVGAALLVVTDGLFEGLSATGARLGYPDFVDMVRRFPLASRDHALRRLVTSITAINGAPLEDDAAALLISRP